MHIEKTLKLKNNLELEIIHDESPESPREWDNLTRMVCFHQKYWLGDQTTYKKDDFNNWGELEAAIIRQERPLIIKPLYMYDHSGVTIRTSSFGDRWDSGQIGYVWINPKNIDTIGTTMKDNETWDTYIERRDLYLENEVSVYDAYVQGNVYGYRIVDEDGDEQDSCYGFYGDDWRSNGLYEHVQSQLQNIDDL